MHAAPGAQTHAAKDALGWIGVVGEVERKTADVAGDDGEEQPVEATSSNNANARGSFIHDTIADIRRARRRGRS